MSFWVEMFLLLLAGAAVLVFGGVLLAFVRRRDEDQRWANLAAWAHQNGLKFNTDQAVGSLAYGFPLPGVCNHACNFIEGSFDGWQILVFDYYYTLQVVPDRDDPENWQHQYLSVVFVEAGVPLALLSVYPLRFVRKPGPSSEGEETEPGSVEPGKKFYPQYQDGRNLSCELLGTQIMARPVGHDHLFSAKEYGCVLKLLADSLNESLGPAVPRQDGIDVVGE
jgi:hypothetical protein